MVEVHRVDLVMKGKAGYSESVVFVVPLMKLMRFFGAEGQVSDEVVVYARLADGSSGHSKTLTDQIVHQVMDFLAAGVELHLLSALSYGIATNSHTQLSISKKNTGRGSLVVDDENAMVVFNPYPLPFLRTTMGAKVGKWIGISS